MNNFKVFFIFLIAVTGLIYSCCGFVNNKTEYIDFFSPKKGVYVVDIDTNKCPDCIQSYVSNSLETIKEIAQKTDSAVAINAGFFDPTNLETTSYIIDNGNLAADPTLNSRFINNPHNKKYLTAFLNRSEFRVLSCQTIFDRKKSFEITQHNNPAPPNCKIIHSIQAGPELLPDLKLSEEAFVIRKDGKVIKESAGALHKYARSAIGIKNDHVY